MEKTKVSVFEKVQDLLRTSGTITEDLLEEIEEILITGDVGVQTTELIIGNLKKSVRSSGFEDSSKLYTLLKKEIETIVSLKDEKNVTGNNEELMKKPYVIFVVGVNGVGKTTSIGKLCKRYLEKEKSVLLVAADTFRAAAIEQLSVWAERNNVDIVKHKEGADPSAVIFDGIQVAKSRNIDVVIIDTAGRLHNKKGLMNQLEKMKRACQKVLGNAPDEVMLVLDATMGQNAISQAKSFREVVSVNSIILTKLDGTAKGGVIIGIINELKIPVKYVGIGEGIDDLGCFSPKAFVEGLFR